MISSDQGAMSVSRILGVWLISSLIYFAMGEIILAVITLAGHWLGKTLAIPFWKLSLAMLPVGAICTSPALFAKMTNRREL